MLFFVLLQLGCASGIKNLYEAERSAALAVAGPPAGDWAPDLRLRLSGEALDGLVQIVLDQGLLSWDRDLELKAPLGVTVRVEPKADVRSLKLSGSSDCEGCLDIDASLDGKARWSAAGQSGSLPFTARVGGTVSFELKDQGEAWALSGRLRDVDRVQVGIEALGNVDATEVLGDWVDEALKSSKPLELGELGGPELPVRAARLVTRGLDGDIEVQLLSDLETSAPVSAGGSLQSDFELRASTACMLGLARRFAFDKGVIAYETAAIPTSLSATSSNFLLGLRLWHLDGAGWWRDYTVKGRMSAARGELSFSPSEAEEGDKSQGAALADPLALLAEGRILQAVEDGVRQTLPVSQGLRLGEAQIQARVERVVGDDTALVFKGSLSGAEGAAAGAAGGQRGGGLPR